MIERRDWFHIIRVRLKQKDVTLKQLSKITGKSAMTVWNWASGIGEPSDTEARMIINLLYQKDREFCIALLDKERKEITDL